MMIKKVLNKEFIQDFSLYVIVGGIATITEWVLFYFLNIGMELHYIFATTIAYIISTFVNWLSGRLLVFKESNNSLKNEVLGIYIAGIFGLLLNIFIMWFLVNIFNINEMISKIVATGIVFMWSFLVRKLFIYKKR